MSTKANEATESTATTKPSSSTAINRVTLVGRLTAKPELRTTAKGVHVTTARVVTNDREEPQFHDVVLWRQLADFATTYMDKGRLVYIEGRLRTRNWEASDGSTRRTVEVIADRFQALSSRDRKTEVPLG
jgi:single-strand DNA-binding protein